MIRRAPFGAVPHRLLHPCRHRHRRHPRPFRVLALPRQAARRHRRPSDDRARVPARGRRARRGRSHRRDRRRSASRRAVEGVRRHRRDDARRSPQRHRSPRRGRGRADCDIVVNVQGDEPLLDPATIERGGRPARWPTRRGDDHAVPAVLDAADAGQPERREGGRRSTRGSRCISPARRFRTTREPGGPPPRLYRHIGLYAYRRDVPLAPRLARADAARTGANRSSSCARSSTAIASRPWKRPTTPSASTRRRISSASVASRRPVCSGLSSAMERSDKKPVKYIFVTGGVVSSLGKGLAAASIGALLEGHGYKVTLQKFDPYINVDPGTMSPYQHGEVYVTDDGAETDLDLGHYERFTNIGHDAQQQLDDRQDLPVGDPEGAARRLPRPHRAGHSAHHQRDQGLHPRGRPRTSTSCSSRSAARSATSRACRSSKPSASSARTSAARTRSTST